MFFHVPNDNGLHMRLPGGVEAWAGYRQAVKPCQFGLSFNIDLAATAFLTSGPMVNVLTAVSGVFVCVRARYRCVQLPQAPGGGRAGCSRQVCRAVGSSSCPSWRGTLAC